ncbi:MAG: 2-oxo acid dehydrogenase subunit E2, partial [Simkaniaceae bacterium]|nr:2-oxo acid dehydrogenase subunit E2 [Simkaniaceae bacterium]
MKVDIQVPSAGESVTEAVVAAIMKESGTFVYKEEEILELETDKVNQVLYAPEAGTVHLTVSVDDVVTPNQVIGYIDTEGKIEVAAPKEEKDPEPKPSIAPTPARAQTGGARKSVDEFVAGATKEPEQAAAPPPASKPQVAPKAPVNKGEGQTRKRLSGLRKTIAKRLVEVKNNTAMLTMEIRAREKDAFLKKHDVKLGFMSFFVKACTAALKELPDVNAFIDGDEIVYNEGCHISISVSTPKGLMVPVLRSAEKLSFAGVEKGIQEFAKKARDGSISIDDLQGG